MSDIRPDDPRLPKPNWGCLLFLIPIVGIAATFAAYGVLFYSGYTGGSADGERVSLTYEGCAEAVPVLLDRATRMGLGDPEAVTAPGRITLSLTLPSDPEIAARIPGSLGRTAKLTALGGETALLGPADLAGASPRLNLLMSPFTVLELTDAAAERVREHKAAHPDGEIVYLVDDEPIGRETNKKALAGNEIEIPADAENEQERVRQAAEQAVLLGSGPLPCSLQLN